MDDFDRFLESRTPYYQMISSEDELKWFFDHVMFKPAVTESYSMVFVSRHKKLTKEEQKTFGLTRAESEFLEVQTIRAPRIKDKNDLDKPWEFSTFLKAVKRFNVDKGAYTTATGEPLPQKTLAVIFYVNPCSDLKVADAVLDKINEHKSRIAATMANGKSLEDCVEQFQSFGNLLNDIKHFKAQCKGTSYWMDFDVDVPEWFKGHSNFSVKIGNITYKENHTNKYYDMMTSMLTRRFGKGNYVIISTGGGYHILVRTSVIKCNPKDVCEEITEIYNLGLAEGNEPYLDADGNDKFEAIMTSFKDKKTNETSIPGLPLPGTYQYGRPVTVVNKEDFE